MCVTSPEGARTVTKGVGENLQPRLCSRRAEMFRREPHPWASAGGPKHAPFIQALSCLVDSWREKNSVKIKNELRTKRVSC